MTGPTNLFVSDCGGGSGLHRYDLQGAAPVINGTSSLHPETIVATTTGCGLINHPDGFIYANTASGIVQINRTTGLATGPAFGAPGNSLGIAVASNGDIMHMGAGNGPVFRTPVGLASVSFSTAHGTDFVDEIVYAPDGLLYLATRGGGFRLTVVNPNGSLNRNIALPSEPDGMAFHQSGFMVTMNLDGTITKIDVLVGDTISLFASGGARHDMATVGSDECLYVTQDGTTYDDLTVTGENSVVRICPGFVPQVPLVAEVSEVTISGVSTNVSNTTVTMEIRKSGVLVDSGVITVFVADTAATVATALTNAINLGPGNPGIMITNPSSGVIRATSTNDLFDCLFCAGNGPCVNPTDIVPPAKFIHGQLYNKAISVMVPSVSTSGTILLTMLCASAGTYLLYMRGKMLLIRSSP